MSYQASDPASSPVSAPGVHPVPDALAFLAGGWQVERTVRDYAGSVGGEPLVGRFSGTTWFTPSPGRSPAGGTDALLHREAGAFTWRGTTRRAERELLFRAGEPAGTADVHFADGRYFHDLDLRHGHHRAVHPCGHDRYDGTYAVQDHRRWQLRWRVTGPAKDLLLVTDYTRLD